ncbi:histone H4 [Phytophthora nicotianae INRA-310]|uniref:Histone H4 n=1 Tax=Phytophthora nicotianae (strain INRA-310) TaxID=761204 RepID=W2QQU7_PHYN3|nr:histone H4 [Phytophthora nicotianae INRA-310]ETN14869.1 histone H4 [Phytophthora nicotianae INRA-310]
MLIAGACRAGRMSGRGKGVKGIGKGSSKRHRFILRDNIQGISRKSIRRLARRAGVMRMSALVYEESRSALKYSCYAFCKMLWSTQSTQTAKPYQPWM